MPVIQSVFPLQNFLLRDKVSWLFIFTVIVSKAVNVQWTALSLEELELQAVLCKCKSLYSERTAWSLFAFSWLQKDAVFSTVAHAQSRDPCPAIWSLGSKIYRWMCWSSANTYSSVNCPLWKLRSCQVWELKLLAASLFCHSSLPKPCCSPFSLSAHGCCLQLPSWEAWRKQRSTSRRDASVAAGPTEQASPCRTAWNVTTDLVTDISSLPILLSFPSPLALRPNLDLCFTAKCTHRLPRHHCTLFIHPWETDSSFLHHLFPSFLSSKVSAAKLSLFTNLFL